MTYPHIENKEDYEQYQKAVSSFFEREGIQNLSPVYNEDETNEPFFSWRPCECCGRSLGGNRETCSGYNPETDEIYEYDVCINCIYYAEYGRLDDMTMMEIEED